MVIGESSDFVGLGTAEGARLKRTDWQLAPPRFMAGAFR